MMMSRITGLAVCITVLTSCASAAELEKNATLMKLEPNKWVKIHEQKKTDKVRFRRQGHGGSCFDSKRGHLILFGSDTHSRDWKNSPFVYDVAKNEWSRMYPEDSVKTYAVTADGIPVAGEKGDHPWATHTFGCVMYDAGRDEMVICCYPGHMRPNKWGRATKHLWGKIKKHPNWTMDLETRQWKALPCKPQQFFPNSACFDSDRGVVVAHRSGGIFELGGEPRKWKQTFRGRTIPGWGHDNCAYDAKNKKVVIFGTNQNANDIWAYDPAKKSVTKMPTPGKRPPKDQHNPMAFDPKVGKTVILVDKVLERDGRRVKKAQTETWLYDLGADAWTQITTATLPFGCGMNYNMEYDTNHGVLLLVAGGYRGSTAVWALRPKP
jgi:hypothetical protein